MGRYQHIYIYYCINAIIILHYNYFNIYIYIYVHIFKTIIFELIYQIYKDLVVYLPMHIKILSMREIK
jgi:hypothetical protein